jgi:hypothetical protein
MAKEQNGFINVMTVLRCAVADEQFDFERFSNATTFLNLCTFCSRSNTNLGVIVASTK